MNALVFVGDCIEEDIDRVCHLAGQLGVQGVPIFAFQEGMDPVATQAFRQFAKLTGGAHCQFDNTSAGELKALLSAVAVYASGGRSALQKFGKNSNKVVAQITSQVK